MDDFANQHELMIAKLIPKLMHIAAISEDEDLEGYSLDDIWPGATEGHNREYNRVARLFRKEVERWEVIMISMREMEFDLTSYDVLENLQRDEHSSIEVRLGLAFLAGRCHEREKKNVPNEVLQKESNAWKAVLLDLQDPEIPEDPSDADHLP